MSSNRPASTGRTRDLLVALFVGVALAMSMELLHGYWTALPMPWLRSFGKHTVVCILLFLDLCVGMIPAYLIGRLLFRHVSRLLWATALAGLPWVVINIYFDYGAIRGLQLHPSFPSALRATLHSWSFLPGMLVSCLSVPLGFWLAFWLIHREPGSELRV